jgi:hypothetical protein
MKGGLQLRKIWMNVGYRAAEKRRGVFEHLKRRLAA